MPKRATEARLDFYHPATGELRYSINKDVRKIEIEENARDEADDAGFDVSNLHAVHTDRFFEGDEVYVLIREGSGPLAHVWTGVVDSVGSDRLSNAFADLPVKAQDFVYYRLAGVYISDIYEDADPGDIARDLIERYMLPFGIVPKDIEPFGISLDFVSFNGISVLEALRELSELADAEWHGDKDKKFYFYPKKSVASGASVDANKVVRGSFSIESSMANFGNVQRVLGGQRAVFDRENPELFDHWAEVDNATRVIQRVHVSKSAVAQVHLWTHPEFETEPNPDPNLFSNGSLEDGLTGWTANDDGGTNTVAAVPDGTAPNGDDVLHVDKAASSFGHAELDTTIPVTPDQEYTISAFARHVSGSAGEIQARIRDASNDTLQFVNLSWTESGWTRKSETFTAPASADHIFIEVVGFFWGDGGEAYFDAIKVEEGPLTDYRGTEAEDPGAPEAVALAGPVTLRLQADNADATAPANVNDQEYDLAQKTLDHHFLAADGFTNFILPDNVVPPGGYVWLIVESDERGQRVGMDATGPDLLYKTFFNVPIIVTRRDDASRAQYGERHLPPVSNRNIRSEAEAALIAEMKLARHAVPARSGSYEVGALSDLSLVTAPVGTTVEASFPNDGVEAGTPLVLMRKRHEWSEANGGLYSLVHEFSDAERVQRVEDLLLKLHRKLKTIEESVLGASSKMLVDTVREVRDTLLLSDDVTATEDSGGFIVGTSRVGFFIVG